MPHEGQPPSIDTLLRRLRARAADPARRTSSRPTQLGRRLESMSAADLFAMAGDLSAALKGVVAANQAGRVDSEGHARAQELEREMSAPVDDALPAVAQDAAIARAEADLGVSLPPLLRRVYAEVADGGFGPGQGILPLTEVAAEYRELRTPGVMPRGREWPAGLLPVVAMDPGWDCVDASTGRVIAWDPEGLSERSGEDRFRRSFSQAFPSVEAWLADWLDSRTQAEQHAAMMAELMAPEYQVQAARRAREAVRRMTPTERAAAGLPEVGWEQVVWGGLGWDEETGEG